MICDQAKDRLDSVLGQSNSKNFPKNNSQGSVPRPKKILSVKNH